jgi:hypothetical protein
MIMIMLIFSLIVFDIFVFDEVQVQTIYLAGLTEADAFCGCSLELFP